VLYAATRSARRHRAAVVGGFVTLGIIVAAAMVALVIIQRSRGEATRQANVAIAAKADADQQSKLKQGEMSARIKALEDLNKTGLELQRKVEELKRSKEDLEDRGVQLSTALDQAEVARKQAEHANDDAQLATKAAVAAREDAVRARVETEKLLAKERDRVRKLQSQLGSPVIDDLK
jgi:eukaryotic-like serine/threonine-protein kinase